jgi:carbon monoxide dehydrogenase subunit G
MKLSGSATIGHPVGDVYAALTDPAVLVRTLPGCQRLELVGPDSYAATMAAGVGSIKGLFDADVRLSDQSAPESFTLHASGTGVPGTVDAVAQVRLVASAAGGTEVHYAADATVGGVIGGVGQRMLAGVARRTADEFFAAVDRELTTAASGVAAVPPSVELAAAPVSPASGPTAAAPEAPASAERAVWTRPAPPETERRRVRELVLAASFGAGIALLGVLIGALVARW